MMDNTRKLPPPNVIITRSRALSKSAEASSRARLGSMYEEFYPPSPLPHSPPISRSVPSLNTELYGETPVGQGYGTRLLSRAAPSGANSKINWSIYETKLANLESLHQTRGGDKDILDIDSAISKTREFIAKLDSILSSLYFENREEEKQSAESLRNRAYHCLHSLRNLSPPASNVPPDKTDVFEPPIFGSNYHGSTSDISDLEGFLPSSTILPRLEQLEKLFYNVEVLSSNVEKLQSGFGQLESQVDSNTANLEMVNSNLSSISSRLDSVVQEIKGSPYVDLPNALIRLTRVEILCERMEKQTVSSRLNPVVTESIDKLGSDQLEIANKVTGTEREIMRLKRRVVNIDTSLSTLERLVTGPSSQVTVENPRELVSSQASVAPAPPVRQMPVDNKLELDSIFVTIKWNLDLISELISTTVNDTTDPMFVKELYKTELPRLEKFTGTCVSQLAKYMTFSGFSTDFKEEVLRVISAADTWKNCVWSRWKDGELYNLSNHRDSSVDIGKFSANGEQTIFEFLGRFDNYCSGTSSVRADKLFRDHLSDSIKNKIPNLRTNLVAIKEYLVREFGKLETIVEQIFAELERKRVPSSCTMLQRYQILNAITNTMTKLVGLQSIKELNYTEVESYIVSHSFLSKIRALLPERDGIEFVVKIAEKGLDSRHISGRFSFDVLHEYCRNNADALEPAVVSDKVANRGRTVHGIYEQHTNQCQPPLNQQHAGPLPRNTGPANKLPSRPEGVNKFAPRPSIFGEKSWWTGNLTYPCGLSGHQDHEMAGCPQFFSMTPKDRKSNIPWKRVCRNCLRPKAVCSSGKEFCPLRVPPALRCASCEEHAVSKNRTPCNVLFCTFTADIHPKPSVTDLQSALLKYLGELHPSIGTQIVLTAVCFQEKVVSVCTCSTSSRCSCNTASKTSRPNPDSKTPAIDSSTGVRLNIPESQVTKEVQESSCYIMQHFRIGGSLVLGFYDKGANVNMIEGELAEREGLQVISDRPTTIKVAGSNTVVTEYGKYRFRLGPTAGGKFHEITAQGIDNVTTEFSRYPLSEVNSELRSIPGMEDRPLPEYIGGSRVQLLLGITDPELDPVRIFNLPSGLGVYQSVFTDIFGSSICYGGPHRVFSQATINQGPMMASIMFSNEVEMYRQSVYGNSGIALRPRPEVEHLSEIMYSIPVDGSNLKINPTPLTRQDFTIGGCELGSDSDDDWDGEISSLANCCCISVSVHKATIPIARLRELVDADDVGELVSYRCPTCTKCQECRTSDKTKAMSLQESREQTIIEKSVELDLENQLVRVDLPFLKDPVKFMVEKHHGRDNYGQALKVYLSQCKKSDTVKAGMRLVHAELVEKGFMCKLEDLPLDKQQIIRQSGFQHFYLWRTVSKEDSISTPVRMVVDPTMSQLNMILAKGENTLGKILNIILANRTAPYAWTSDISKLYNMLHLQDSALPFSLFLFHESLSSSVKPQVWCMTRAWYGVVPTGNQASFAISALVDTFGPEYPEAVHPLNDCRYVDDVASGASSLEKREAQIEQSTLVLGKGGFKFKYIVRSGEKPCSQASSDGVCLKMLGYKWNPEEDVYSPGLGELNFSRKKRGSKTPNLFPVVTRADAEKLLRSLIITRKLVVAKVSEFYDPCGLYEPIKLQMKLDLSNLNNTPWEEPLDPEVQLSWKSRFLDYIDYPQITARRCVVGLSEGDKPIRLLGLADAGKAAGGAVVYAGVKQDNGTYTCSMLVSKSRLMRGTVPRNELNALMLLTELVFIAKKAIGSRVEEVLYLTDSTVALAWCQSSSGRRLRLYVNNRVETIKRMVEWTLNTDEITDPGSLPLFHVAGIDNLADLLTKPHDISTEKVTIGSDWESGLVWMKLPTDEMPITKYSRLQVPSESSTQADLECFDEPFLLTQGLKSSAYMTQDSEDLEQLICVQEIDEPILDNVSSYIIQSDPVDRGLLVDVVGLGWAKAIRVLSLIIRFTTKLRHTVEPVFNCKMKGVCIECKYGHDNIAKIDEYSLLAENYLFRRESLVILKTVPEKERSKLISKNGIFYYVSRLTEDQPFSYEDLEKGLPYYDGLGFTGVLPLVLSSSPILHSYLLYVHLSLAPHTGVEFTMREVSRKMMVKQGLRRLVRNIRKDCTRCRGILLKTIELEMSRHTAARTIISPPFFHCMVDIAYNFPGLAFKNSRKHVKLYALVIVCLLTSATSILVLEGIATEDICAAIERHSCRYGIPACLYIDQGTQLKALQHASFSCKTLETMLVERLDVRIVVSKAKAHNERGRVENKIKVTRATLEQLGEKAKHPQTAVQWETLFWKISNSIDNTPLAKGNSSSGTDVGFDVITANRIKLGRNNYRAMHGAGVDLLMSANLGRLLEKNQELYHFWYKSYIQNIHQFALKPSKWSRSDDLPVIGDVVLFVYKEDPTYSKRDADWKVGRVVVVEERMIAVEFISSVRRSGETVKKTLQRNPRDVVVLLGVDELAINSSNYFSRLLTSQTEIDGETD